MNERSQIFSELDLRRRELGMSIGDLASKTGISWPTAQRILSGQHNIATFTKVSALADALGMNIDLRSVVDPEDLRERQAQKKAQRLVKMVQGTSALEAQAVNKNNYEQMLRRTVHELLAGPPRKLWAK